MSRGKKNVNIEQNRVQLTGQILEPMKQVCACAYILFHSPSISCAHAQARFFKYILFDTSVWVNIEEKKIEDFDVRSVNITKD